MEFNACPCSGKTLGRLMQPALMAFLAEESTHGYVLVQRLTGMAMFRGHAPDPTGVYRMLRNMEDDNLVRSSWDLTDTGPARRRFTLTDSGRRCLHRWLQTLEEYALAIEDLLTVVKASHPKRS